MESSKQSFDWDEVRDSVLIAEQSVELERLMASSDEGVYENNLTYHRAGQDSGAEPDNA